MLVLAAGLNAPEHETSVLEGTPAHVVLQEARQVQAFAHVTCTCAARVSRKGPNKAQVPHCQGSQLFQGSADLAILIFRVQHVRAEYQAALPALQALLAAFPEHITPEQVSEERFLWACSLWYSYAMEASLSHLPSSAWYRGYLQSPVRMKHPLQNWRYVPSL